MKIVDQIFEFVLNTPYSLAALDEWIMDGLNAKYKTGSKEYFYQFKNCPELPPIDAYHVDRDTSEKYYKIANCEFCAELYCAKSNDWTKRGNYVLRTQKMQNNISDEAFIEFNLNVFKVVHEEACLLYKNSDLGWDYEHFFFKNVEYGHLMEYEGNIFKDMKFEQLFAVEYPNAEQTKAVYESALTSDFIDNLNVELAFKKVADKEKNVHTSVVALYKGDCPAKQYPIEEQEYLVEDVTKELLARGAMLKKEIEMKLNE